MMPRAALHLRPLPIPPAQAFLLQNSQVPFLRRHCCFPSNSNILLLSSARELHILRSTEWDSVAEPDNVGNSNESVNADEGIEEQWIQLFKDYIESIWIFKVFGSFGWMLPAILLSMLFATGPKAFLMALAVPIGHSTFSFAFTKFQNRGNVNEKLTTPTSNADDLFVRSGLMLKKTEENQSQVPKKYDTNSSSFRGWDDLDTSTKTNSDNDSGVHLGGWDEVILIVESKFRRKSSSKRTTRRSNGRRKRSQEEPWDQDVGSLLMRLLIFILPFVSKWIEIMMSINDSYT